MKRREYLTFALAGGVAMAATPVLRAQTAPDVAALLRAGGCAVMLRHAQTEEGIGDPPNFNLGQCATQRNLSATGRAQAAAIGQWFSSRGLFPSNVPDRVQSSAWCRCKDTATLAFGQFSVLAALNSTFNGRGNVATQTTALRMRLPAIRPGTFEVWVTHQVNVSALTGEPVAMGEALVIRAATADSAVVVAARSRF